MQRHACSNMLLTTMVNFNFFLKKILFLCIMSTKKKYIFKSNFSYFEDLQNLGCYTVLLVANSLISTPSSYIERSYCVCETDIDFILQKRLLYIMEGSPSYITHTCMHIHTMHACVSFYIVQYCYIMEGSPSYIERSYCVCVKQHTCMHTPTRTRAHTLLFSLNKKYNGRHFSEAIKYGSF